MRNLVIALINEYAGKTTGNYYPLNELQSHSNQDLLDLLLEEYADYVSVIENRR